MELKSKIYKNGEDITNQLTKKAIAVAHYIGQIENLPIEMAFEKYIASAHFKKVVDEMYTCSEQEIIMSYAMDKSGRFNHEHQESPLPLEQQEKRTSLEGCLYCFEDQDFGPLVQSKAEAVAHIIAREENIPYEDAFIAYINSASFKEVEDLDTHLVAKAPEQLYFAYEQKKNIDMPKVK